MEIHSQNTIELLSGKFKNENKYIFSSSSKATLTKLAIVMTFTIFIWLINNYTYASEDNSKLTQNCYYDLFFEASDGINTNLENNSSIRNIIIAISSLFVDTLILSTFFLWIIVWKDWKMPIKMVIFYLIRYICLHLFEQRYPEGYLFTNPGIPSIVVSYINSNDFFYSGHCGFPILLYDEYSKRKKSNKMKYICIFVSFVEFCTMISVRGHYSIDLIFGILISLYINKMTSNYWFESKN
jgi:hypothetical protein